MSDIISIYSKSFILLNQYDENKVPTIKGTNPIFILNYEEAKKEISKLKQFLIQKQEASELFGLEKMIIFVINSIEIRYLL